LGGFGAVLALEACGSNGLAEATPGTTGGSAGTSGTGTGGTTGTGTTGGSSAGTTAAASATGSSSGGATVSLDGGSNANLCVLETNVTEGPYWIDVGLERSNVTTNSAASDAGTSAQPGLPLSLSMTIFAYDKAAKTCGPLAGARVDIWHCNGSGVYSDVQNLSGQDTVGEDFLRGYQVTDANGNVTFQTIYPGWYSGRAVHVHVRVRVYGAANDLTAEAVTQLFFDDTLTSSVFAQNSPYDQRGTRDTFNATDMVYTQESPALLCTLIGSTSGSLAASVAFGIDTSVVFGG
jgi:protocatechuate 3,4-dioxygenase beta subunit